MKPLLATATAAALMLVAPALAATSDADAASDNTMTAPTGDPAAGEKVFSKQCVTCHVVKDADGNTLAGKNGRVGPNLYGVAGRTAGIEEGFNYGRSMKKAGEQGIVWTEAHFVNYVQDPTKWLRAVLDDKHARGKMSWKVRDPQEALDVYAYLYSLAPPKDAAQ